MILDVAKRQTAGQGLIAMPGLCQVEFELATNVAQAGSQKELDQRLVEASAVVHRRPEFGIDPVLKADELTVCRQVQTVPISQ